MILISGFIWLHDPLGIWFMLLMMCSVVISCCITERWCLMLTFDRDGVLYKPLFRKGMRIQYSNYPRIQYAYYMHGNMFAAYKVNFFVFTNRRLTNEELTQINQVAPRTTDTPRRSHARRCPGTGAVRLCVQQAAVHDLLQGAGRILVGDVFKEQLRRDQFIIASVNVFAHDGLQQCLEIHALLRG